MKKVDNFEPSKWLVENKLTFQSKLSESDNENILPIEDLKKSTEEIKKWIHNTIPSDLEPNERGDQVLNVKNDIDYAILIDSNNYIFKLDNKDFELFSLIRRENGNEEIFAHSENKKTNDGTITNSRYYVFKPSNEDSFTNGIVTLSYKGNQIGNVEPRTDQDNEMDKDNIEYAIFGEGPTFTNSQMGGHGFYDWDMKKLIKTGGDRNHKVIEKGGKINMITEFNPSDYIDEESFKKYWVKNNKNNKIQMEGNEDSWTITLTNKDGKWFIIDSIDKNTLEDIQNENK